jgi:LacI family transcriptional regulator, repressor for deo operon, udp, cdd, tsx, nupC, and nupG
MRIHKTSPAKIADVARLAGVSVATVSRALANPDVVSAEARTRVLDAVRAIGYTPNAAARNLRARRTMMVLVVVPDIANPFFAEVLRGIDSKLSTHGYGLIIANLDNSPAKEPRYVELAHARQVDGILLLCGHIPRDPKRSMADAGIPMVAACERIPDVSIPQVEINNRKAACEAVAHLASLGHQRIAYISGPKGNILDQERRAGYLDALNSVGLQADGMLDLEGDFTFRSGAKAATRLLAMARNVQPTAIFAANDEMAIGCIKTLHAAGIRIPQELSVVGFDAVEYADYCEPTLTTVRQPRNEIGAQAALLLVQSMARTGETPDIRVTLDACFSLRESTARIRDSIEACPESDSS